MLIVVGIVVLSEGRGYGGGGRERLRCAGLEQMGWPGLLLLVLLLLLMVLLMLLLLLLLLVVGVV